MHEKKGKHKSPHTEQRTTNGAVLHISCHGQSKRHESKPKSNNPSRGETNRSEQRMAKREK